MADPTRRRMLAIAFGPPTMAEALAGLPQIRAEADCVELRLDLFEEPFDLPTLLRECGDLPVVATLRPPHQGGNSPLSSGERLNVLVRAAKLGAEYVDVEWDAVTPEALEALHAAGAAVIVSRHDFSAMPPELADRWWDELVALGADVVKVVGTAHDVRDCLPILGVLARASLRTIAIAMGEAGLLSRVLALREEQCFLTYATLGQGAPTAPGQLTVGELRGTYRVERLRSDTRIYGLLGPHAEPARLSEYNSWFYGDHQNGVAVPFVTHEDGSGIVSAFRELPVAGWHIHGSELQTDVLRVLDELARSAGRQNKANGIVRRPDGALVGHWVESPREQYDLWIAEQ